jgi:ligand-binding sensor domain-containing protein
MDNPSSPLNRMNCTLRSIVGDSLNNLWLATDIGLIYFDRINNTITQFTHDPDDPGSLSNNSLEDIHIDRKDNLWITTRKGLNLLEANKTFFKHVKYDKSGKEIINTFFSGYCRG